MEELRVGVIGFGFIGKVHAYSYLSLPFYYSPPPCRVTLAGVATSRRESAEAALATHPFEFAVSDYRELIDRDDIHAISVCTPNDSHADILLRAIEKGKHIYCDKPLTKTAEEAARVVAALGGYEGVTQMTLHNRFFPATMRAKQLIAEGFVGTVTSFRGLYLHSGAADPNRPYSWRMSREKSGGGGLADLGAHALDLLQWLVGPMREVFCRTETVIKERPLPDGSGMGVVDVDDVAHLMLRAEGGAVGAVETSRVATGAANELRFEIHGDRGAIRFNLDEPNWLEVFDNTAAGDPCGGMKGFTRVQCLQKYPPPSAFPPPQHGLGWMRAHIASIHNFVDAVATRRPASPDLRDGARLQTLLDTAYASADEGAWKTVPTD